MQATIHPPFQREYTDVVRVRVMVKAYAELRTPEAISLEHWMITPAKVKEYRKSRKWLKVLRDAADKAAIAAASKPPEPSASENAKSER